jgi:hypothetical protein
MGFNSGLKGLMDFGISGVDPYGSTTRMAYTGKLFIHIFVIIYNSACNAIFTVLFEIFVLFL